MVLELDHLVDLALLRSISGSLSEACLVCEPLLVLSLACSPVDNNDSIHRFAYFGNLIGETRQTLPYSGLGI